MHQYLKYSIEFANQRNYLDELSRVYTMTPNGLRDIPQAEWSRIEAAFLCQDNKQLIASLLELPLFPIKDSYVAYLRRDPEAIGRNPRTINRLAGRLYELGINKLWEQCSLPKESNQQIGPMFRNWVNSGSMGLRPVGVQTFLQSEEDSILDASDRRMQEVASDLWGYTRDKGIDFIARFRGRYIVGEAKFLTDFGGHQNAQLHDALSIFSLSHPDVIPIAILDGVLYISRGRSKMYRIITEDYADFPIMSTLVLRDYLYSL